MHALPVGQKNRTGRRDPALVVVAQRQCRPLPEVADSFFERFPSQDQTIQRTGRSPHVVRRYVELSTIIDCSRVTVSQITEMLAVYMPKRNRLVSGWQGTTLLDSFWVSSKVAFELVIH